MFLQSPFPDLIRTKQAKQASVAKAESFVDFRTVQCHIVLLSSCP